jgi:hypothetical protein
MAENASRDKSELLSAENQIQQNRREKSATRTGAGLRRNPAEKIQATAAND